MPRTLGGLVGWLISTVIIVAVGMAIINRIPPLRRLLNG